VIDPYKTLALLRGKRQILEGAVDALLALADGMVRKIDEATRSLSLTEAEREVAIDAARTDANERFDGKVAAVADARDRAIAAVKAVLDPIEPPAGEDAVALEQVRRLLSQDLQPVQIVARARELRDAATLRALRWELRYWTPIGDFTDHLQQSIEGLRDTINRKLVEIIDGDESKAYVEALKLAARADAAIHVERIAVKIVVSNNGATSDRIALAYALNMMEHAADPVALPAPDAATQPV
jgi:hypothetical protein